MAAPTLPAALTTGSLFQFVTGSLFWRATAVANYIRTAFRFAIVDVAAAQHAHEASAAADAAATEGAALPAWACWTATAWTWRQAATPWCA